MTETREVCFFDDPCPRQEQDQDESNGMNKETLQFIEDPLAFARQHVLFPDAGIETQITNNAWVGHKYKGLYCTLGSALRVYYGHVEADTEGTAPIMSLKLNRFYRKDRFPIYWLPWKRDAVTKVKLRDGRPRLFLNQEGRARLFITAALSGCSVFVEGDPRMPTVYHFNTLSPTALPPSPLDHVDPHDPEAKTRNAGFRFVMASEQKTHQRLGAILKARSTKTGHEHLAQKSVFTTMVQNSFQPRDYRYDVQDLQRRAEARSSSGDFLIDDGLGLVLGIQDSTGPWSFHRQERHRRVDRFGTKSYELKPFVQFWP